MNLRSFKFLLLISLLPVLHSCKSQATDNSQQDRPVNDRSTAGRSGGGRPTADEIIVMMDVNKDNLIELNEAEGPIKNDFETIDADDDGFITKEELENAPKPDRQGGQGGGRR